MVVTQIQDSSSWLNGTSLSQPSRIRTFSLKPDFSAEGMAQVSSFRADGRVKDEVRGSRHSPNRDSAHMENGLTKRETSESASAARQQRDSAGQKAIKPIQMVGMLQGLEDVVMTAQVIHRHPDPDQDPGTGVGVTAHPAEAMVDVLLMIRGEP